MRPLNDAWFEMLDSYQGSMFYDRKDANHLNVWVRFCNWELRWELEKKIMEHRGVVTYAAIDRQSSAILMKVIEPKALIAEREVEAAAKGSTLSDPDCRD